MAVGSLIWSGTVTIPAGTPGTKGTVTTAASGALAATDVVVATLAHSAEQDLSRIKREDYTFQVIKDASANTVTFEAVQKQNPAMKVDYIVMGVSS